MAFKDDNLFARWKDETGVCAECDNINRFMVEKDLNCKPKSEGVVALFGHWLLFSEKIPDSLKRFSPGTQKRIVQWYKTARKNNNNVDEDLEDDDIDQLGGRISKDWNRLAMADVEFGMEDRYHVDINNWCVRALPGSRQSLAWYVNNVTIS
ncbi:9344_t:CDS:2 [Paraglomus brasilianum]|uniref:9344_t:CDS:1 n=1 Tax=Paraglomus brasilianum TaxID=144538 RepID=A0A9N9BAU4_9GLOM|nr:9344_t:CDS:2 [Paraglomus brasilianum]